MQGHERRQARVHSANHHDTDSGSEGTNASKSTSVDDNCNSDTTNESGNDDKEINFDSEEHGNNTDASSC